MASYDFEREFEMREFAARSLSKLKAREAAVLICNFGIGEPEMTITEIAKAMGVSQSRAWQIKERALFQLRKRFRKGLNPLHG